MKKNAVLYANLFHNDLSLYICEYTYLPDEKLYPLSRMNINSRYTLQSFYVILDFSHLAPLSSFALVYNQILITKCFVIFHNWSLKFSQTLSRITISSCLSPSSHCVQPLMAFIVVNNQQAIEDFVNQTSVQQINRIYSYLEKKKKEKSLLEKTSRQ